MKAFLQNALLVLLAAVFIAGSGRVQQGLLLQRTELTQGNIAPVENMPPWVAFVTVALGGFRGLIVDALWLRATRMQEEGRYFELVQLSDWMTKLEPRFPQIWEFHSWNLAWNVSVLFNEHEDRWRWVQHGMRMLRDEGLVYNPGAPQLYWALGWIFQFKMGANLDDAHYFYKESWAREMGALFDGMAPDYEQYLEAPDTMDGLREDPAAQPLIKRLAETGITILELDAITSSNATDQVRELMSDDPAALLLRVSLKRQRLKEVYKLDVEKMKDVDDAYGPLDWRLPDAHALYWAEQGKQHAEGFTALSLDRMTSQSLASAFRVGSAFFDIDGQLIPSPNLAIYQHVRKAYLEALEKHDNESFHTAYENFLNLAFNYHIGFNRTEVAHEIFKEIKERYPSDRTDRGFNHFVATSFGEAQRELNGQEVRAVAEGFIIQGFTWYARGDEDRYRGAVAQATAFYRDHRKEFNSQSHWERVGLPEFNRLVFKAFHELLTRVEHPVARQRLEQLQIDEGIPDKAPDPESPLEEI